MASLVSAAARPAVYRRPAEYLLLLGSVATLLAILVTAELSLRAAAPQDLIGPAAMERLHRPSEAYGWEPRPGFSARIDGMRTTINARGARGSEPDSQRMARRRILVLGDSIAFGWGVHDEESFAALLDARTGDAVLNLAVEGYGLDQTLLRYEREGTSFAPHVVVLSFCVANDFVDTALAAFLYDGSTPKPYFRLEGGGLRLHEEHLRRPLRERAASELHQSFEVFRWMRARRSPTRSSSDPHWAEVARRVTERRAEAFELTLRLLERIATGARARGAEVVLLVHPSQRSFREPGLESDLLRSQRLRDVTVVDMRARYVQRGLGFGEIALDRLGHLSPVGHREVAAVVREMIEG